MIITQPRLTSFLAAVLAFASFNTVASVSAFADPCPNSISASCSFLKNGGYNCVDAIAGVYPIPLFQQRCEAISGAVFALSRCATANEVGSCVYYTRNGVKDEVIHYFAPAVAEKIPTICANDHGTVCEE